MSRTSLKIAAGSLAFAFFASGCLTPMSDAVTGAIAATAAATVTNSSGGDIYLAVDTAWEQTSTDFTRHGICQVNTGDAVRTQTCTIRIPEGRLFFSNTKLTFGTANYTTCHRIQFIPPIYQVSNGAAATLATDPSTVVNCAASSLISIPGIPAIPAVGSDLGCFSGPAKALYSAWPSPLGKYFNTSATSTNESSETITAANANTSFPSMIDDNWLANLGVANKIDDPTTSITSPGGYDVYLANTLQPYRARCVDEFEQVQAEVLVYIADEDLETGEDPGNVGNDQFYDFLQTL